MLLHHGLKTMALTSMGMAITSTMRMVECVMTASSFKFLLTAGYLKILKFNIHPFNLEWKEFSLSISFRLIIFYL